MEENQMTFWGHLEELRWSLVRVVVVLLVALVACFCAMPTLFDSVVLAPSRGDFFLYRALGVAESILPFGGANGFSVDIVNINVASQFLTHIKTSFWVALLVAFPYLIYEAWRFVRPALRPNEMRGVSIAFFGGMLMFYAGCAVGYAVVFPLTFRFLADYNLSEQITNHISLDSYMGNFLGVIFMLGVVFELPLLTWVLSKIGIVNRRILRQYRRHAVVVLLALAAVITPSGDPFTLMVVFMPLYLLYEMGIVLCQKERREE